MSKEQNNFRDDGNERLSPKEQMKRRHLRSEEKSDFSGRINAIKIALFCLMQTGWIFYSYRMLDGSPIMDNVQ